MKSLEKKEWIAVTVSIIVIAILFFGHSIWNMIIGPQTPQQPLNATGTTTMSDTTAPKNISTIKGLEIYDMQVGTGTAATVGKKVTAHYIGTLVDGTKFDSSLDRNRPFTFTLGGGQVIKGWDQGIAGMKIGGIRTLVISPELGYGAQALGSIPANSTLIFQVQVLDVQ